MNDSMNNKTNDDNTQTSPVIEALEGYFQQAGYFPGQTEKSYNSISENFENNKKMLEVFRK